MKKTTALLLILALCCTLLSTAALAGRIQAPEDAFTYDETDADSVRVTVTVSNDGAPIYGADDASTVLAGLTVDVPYFDLSLYGLETFDRYPITDDAVPVYDTTQSVIRRPTALHLYIYLLERYYLGYPEKDCCKGLAETPEWNSGGTKILPNRKDSGADPTVNDIAGGKFGNAKGDEKLSGLTISGSPRSLYMLNFWGHDQNLMYYRNHAYPYWYTATGSTCDYVLLSDGDCIDIAMFSNWSFWKDGAFACFAKDTYTTKTDEPLTVQTLKYATQSVADGGTDSFAPAPGLTFAVYDEDWVQQSADAVQVTCTDEETAAYSLTFTDPGTYYLLARDPNWATDDANTAPAVAKVIVTGTPMPAGLQNAKLTAGQGGTANITVRFDDEADGTTLLAAAFRNGRLVSLTAREIVPGKMTLTLPAQPGDTVKLFHTYDRCPLEAAYSSILGG